MLAAAPAPGSGPGQARAQVPGQCEQGRATNVLDIGDVRARVFNTGSLFFGYDGVTGYQAAYEVPKGSGKSPLYAAGLWVGGFVDGGLRAAGASYANFEFWPGPLDAATGRPPDPADCSAYDRIWRVSRHDVAEYYRTGVATPDLAEWPHDLGAPVLDGDGDPANYELAAGDQPAISGDQMLWWVMNDVGNVHQWTLTPPIGLEVRVEAIAVGDRPDALNRATFFRYTIRSAASTLDSAVVGLFADVDLGDPVDDYVGSDSLRNLAFVYNSDDADGFPNCTYCYGDQPPAFGFVALDGPMALPNGLDDDGDGEVDEPGERGRLGAFRHLIDGFGPTRNPHGGPSMYAALRGRWFDGTPLTRGGFGWNPGSSDVTTFGYSGDPVPPRFWSERCPGAPQCGLPITPYDRGFVASFRPTRLAAGDSDQAVFALVYGQGTSHLQSVAALRQSATTVAIAFDAGLLEPRRVPGFVVEPLPAGIELHRPAPNPFTDEAVMSVTLPAAAGVRVALVDVLGREVAVLADGPHEAGRHPIAIAAAGLAPGVYVARVWVNGQPAGALPVTRR
jgi:hypothetical protein